MDPVEELRYLVLAAQREGSRTFTEALRPLGVTPAQAEVLTVLREAEQPLSVRELGELLVCETGSPSRLANSMVASGYLQSERDTTDGRITRLRLTPTGRAIADAVQAAEQGLYRQLAAVLPDPDTLSVVTTLLRAFVAGRPAGNALARRRDRDGPGSKPTP